MVYTLFNVAFIAVDAVKWAPSMLFTIPKKGNLRLPENWRGIQLSEYFNAWDDRILSNRIKLWMSVDEFQTAYRKSIELVKLRNFINNNKNTSLEIRLKVF